MIIMKSTLQTKILATSFSAHWKRRIKTLSDIPGPRRLPLIGSSWKYFPFVGDYNVNKLHQVGKKKLNSYGEVVLEQVAGVKAVNVFRPDDIQAVYQAEGKHPKRRSHLALDHYRKQRPHLYNSGGLFPSNGEKWYRLRQAFQQPVSSLQETRLFLPTADNIIHNFFDNIIVNKNISDFLPLISNLNLHLTWSALFGEESLASMSNETAEQLVQATEVCNESVLATDNTEYIWKRFKTSVYRHFENNMEFIESLALENIKDFETHCVKHRENTIIAKFLKLQNVDRKDLLGMVIDLLLGGIDTTSYTSCFLLYALCKNPRCQEKLHKEAIEILLTSSDSVETSDLSKATYTRAVLKETFRLNPISVGTSRFLERDVLLPSGYLLPKGTLVMTQNMVACRRERNFNRASEFLPERWLPEENLYRGRPHPYLLLPFGHGPRACLARRRAEQNLLLFIIRLSRNFFLEWTGEGELGIITPLINKPDRPVSIRISPWS